MLSVAGVVVEPFIAKAPFSDEEGVGMIIVLQAAMERRFFCQCE
jgi:hypothetical protein